MERNRTSTLRTLRPSVVRWADLLSCWREEWLEVQRHLVYLLTFSPAIHELSLHSELLDTYMCFTVEPLLSIDHVSFIDTLATSTEHLRATHAEVEHELTRVLELFVEMSQAFATRCSTLPMTVAERRELVILLQEMLHFQSKSHGRLYKLYHDVPHGLRRATYAILTREVAESSDQAPACFRGLEVIRELISVCGSFKSTARRCMDIQSVGSAVSQ